MGHGLVKDLKNELPCRSLPWVQFSGLTAPSHRKGVERVLVAERMAEVVMWSGY